MAVNDNQIDNQTYRDPPIPTVRFIRLKKHTGCIVDLCEFPNGVVVANWDGRNSFPATTFYRNISDALDTTRKNTTKICDRIVALDDSPKVDQRIFL